MKALLQDLRLHETSSVSGFGRNMNLILHWQNGLGHGTTSETCSSHICAIPMSNPSTPYSFWFRTSRSIPSKNTVDAKNPHKSKVKLRENLPDAPEAGNTNFYICCLWELHNYNSWHI